MISNLNTQDAAEKRISLVYNSDVSGFQALDFSKIDNLEDILKNWSGEGLNVNQDDLNYLADTVSVSGALFELISGFNSNGVNVHQDDLNAIVDNVTAYQPRGHTISNYTVSGSNGTILVANENRKELYIQNLATGTLYVKYGTLAASNSFNFVLAGNTYVNGGDGGSISDQGYTGIVSVSGANNLTPNYISWERL